MKKCVYCGEREANTNDHIPPICLFPVPRPSNLITVPCCTICNGKYGQDDEQIRNILTFLGSTENHPAIVNQIANKRDRSFKKKGGESKLEYLINNSVLVDFHTKGGIYLGKKSAFNFDNPMWDKFFNRMARGLLHHENSFGYVECTTDWKKLEENITPEDVPEDLKIAIQYGKLVIIGDNIFQYIGCFHPSIITSLWFLIFYGGVVFKVMIKEEASG
ncbi:hypothetical protein CEE37_12660 [candidate division LCP-89 bacterium B3_LCP]|uniref:HNH endonuclease 5 domain-containing protein n=1 Tax=candidate division LCP-89 bacterium B3_LCP TaxID=2012998 RepID=A0A532UTU4_UNCL8|nr:MAG: hypothetical protein CEE37_12660 [candidate division LCP-89 bacterium B3_LCP]